MPPMVSTRGAVAGGSSRRSPALPAAATTVIPASTSASAASSTGLPRSVATGSPDTDRLTTRTPSPGPSPPQPLERANDRGVRVVPILVAPLDEHQVLLAGQSGVQAVAQPPISCRHHAGHHAVPLPV